MKSLLLVLTLAIHTLAIAQSETFTSSIDTNRILIGEQIELTLKAELKKGVAFNWPIVPDTLKGLEWVEIGGVDTSIVDDSWRLVQTLKLTSFDSGYVAIPPFSLQIGENNYVSPAIPIEVAMVQLSEETDLYDIKAPLQAPINWIPILLWGGGILLFIAIAVIGTLWLLNRKKQVKLTPEQKLSPYEYAQLQLKEIENEQLWQAGKTKEYYSRLTDVMRLYMERQMGKHAMESTADEVIDQLETLGLPDPFFKKTSALLSLSAMVKFAKEKPSLAQNEAALLTVKEFLEVTKPKVEPQEAKQN